jgi:hypothetical protein
MSTIGGVRDSLGKRFLWHTIRYTSDANTVPKRAGTTISDGTNKYIFYLFSVVCMAYVRELNCHNILNKDSIPPVSLSILQNLKRKIFAISNRIL